MTPEEKQLLLKDLCARLPYGVKAVQHRQNGQISIGIITAIDIPLFGVELDNSATLVVSLKTLKPYLRPIESMTEEEKEEYESFVGYGEYDTGSLNGHHEYNYVEVDKIIEYVNWLNAHHFDYRGLIPMGLALEAPEGMYKID